MSYIAVKRLRVIAFTAIAIGSANTATAANSEALVVTRLYKDYAWQAMASQTPLFGEDIAHQNKAVLGKYFSPALTDLLLKDSACQLAYQGICKLDFDVLFNSQDPRVTDLDVTKTSPGNVTVSFKDPVDGHETRIDYVVVQIAGQWKIADVYYWNPDKASLKQLLSQKLP